MYLAKFLARSQRVLHYIFIAGWWILVSYVCAKLLIQHFLWQVSYVVKYLMAGQLFISDVVMFVFSVLFASSLISRALRSDRYQGVQEFIALCGLVLVTFIFANAVRFSFSTQGSLDLGHGLFIILLLVSFFSFSRGDGFGKNYDPAKTNAHLVSPVFVRLFDIKYISAAAVAVVLLLGLHVVDVGRASAFGHMARTVEKFSAQVDLESMRERFDQDAVMADLFGGLANGGEAILSGQYKVVYIFPQPSADKVTSYKAVFANGGMPSMRGLKSEEIQQMHVSEHALDLSVACGDFCEYWEEFQQAGQSPYGFLLRGIAARSFYEEYVMFFKQQTAAGDVIVLLKMKKPPREFMCR